jgi:hypothetical protein
LIGATAAAARDAIREPESGRRYTCAAIAARACGSIAANGAVPGTTAGTVLASGVAGPATKVRAGTRATIVILSTRAAAVVSAAAGCRVIAATLAADCGCDCAESCRSANAPGSSGPMNRAATTRTDANRSRAG